MSLKRSNFKAVLITHNIVRCIVTICCRYIIFIFFIAIFASRNKIDLATDEQLEDFKSFIEKKGLPYFPIVAPIKYGTKELINAVAEKLSTLPPVKKYEAEEIPLSVLESKKNNGFKVTVNDGVYSVEADWLYRILSKTDLDDYASLQYFQTVLKSSGIIDELVKQGIQEGDTVSIYDLEFDYIP